MNPETTKCLVRFTSDGEEYWMMVHGGNPQIGDRVRTAGGDEAVVVAIVPE